MSSEVGPNPPVVMIKSARISASRTACSMSAPRSATATCRATMYPQSASRRQSHCWCVFSTRHDPPLPAADRARRNERDRVTDLRFPFFVMRHEPRRQPLLLAVHAVTNLPLDGDDHTLGHLVADEE